eukprot:COSAG06_NODE_15184_length_1091_cov_2.355847_1_plen_95_part_10
MATSEEAEKRRRPPLRRPRHYDSYTAAVLTVVCLSVCLVQLMSQTAFWELCFFHMNTIQQPMTLIDKILSSPSILGLLREDEAFEREVLQKFVNR